MSYLIQNENYIILYNDKKAQAWSTDEIPFEPKGWKKEMKSAIKKTLGQLSVDSSRGQIYASYTANSDKFCDVENILLYNIGEGAFKNICQSALCIERGYDTVLPPPQFQTTMPHYYKYELVNNADFKIHKPKTILAEWEGYECEKVHQTPSFYWKYVKSSLVNILFKDYNGKFGIEVKIGAPCPINLAGIIKALLDGIICAFHQHNGHVDDDVSNALFIQTGLDKSSSGHLLFDNKFNALGKRNLIRKYRNAIIWNPADDRCIAIKLILNRTLNNWKIDGKIFSVL